MTDFWVGIAAAKHVRTAVAGGFVMFSHGERAAVERVKPGDWVAYYSPREGMKEGAEVRAFTAIGQMLEGEAAEREMMPGHSGWYRPIRWLEAKPADIYPLLERFSFVKDRQHWGMYFRKSLFGIAGDDFRLIAEAMSAGEEFRKSAAT